jgi:hypothetical protein
MPTATTKARPNPGAHMGHKKLRQYDIALDAGGCKLVVLYGFLARLWTGLDPSGRLSR